MVRLRGLNKKKRGMSARDIDRLAEASELFEQAGIDVPILSVFERRESKVRTSQLSIMREKILVSDLLFIRPRPHIFESGF